MIKLSTGKDSTLENYIIISKAMFGADSAATKFLEDKAAGAKEGIKAEVIAPESQVVALLLETHVRGEREKNETDRTNHL